MRLQECRPVKKRLLSSSVFRAIEAVWAAAIVLIVTPLLINALGTDSYGLWLLLLSGIGLLTFFELGFASAVQRRMAQAIEHHNILKLNQLYSSALCLFSLLSVLAIAALTVLILFPALLGIGQIHQQLATTALCLFIVKVLLDFLANAIHGIFSGHLRFDLDSTISIVAMTTKAVLMVLLVKQYGVLGLVLITLVTDVIAQLAKFILAYRIQPGLTLLRPVNFRQDCADLFGYARHVIFLDLAKLVQDKSVLILISQLLGLVAISIYAIADRLLRQATMLVQTVTMVLQPYLIRRMEQGQLSELLMQKTMQLQVWFTAMVLLPVMFCGPAFIMLWVGPDFALSQSLLLILLLAALLRVIALPVSQFLLAKALHQWLAPLELVAAIGYIFLVLLLGNFYGLYGVAWGGVITALAVHTLGYSLLAYYKLNIGFRFSLMLVCRLILMFILLYLINRHFNLFSAEMTWVSMLLSVPVSICLAVVLGYFWLLDGSMRTMLWQIFRQQVNAVIVKSVK